MSYKQLTADLKKGEQVILVFEALQNGAALNTASLSNKFKLVKNPVLPIDQSAQVAQLTEAVGQGQKQIKLLEQQAQEGAKHAKNLDAIIADLRKQLANPATSVQLQPDAPVLLGINADGSITIGTVPGAEKLIDYEVKTS